MRRIEVAFGGHEAPHDEGAPPREVPLQVRQLRLPVQSVRRAAQPQEAENMQRFQRSG